MHFHHHPEFQYGGRKTGNGKIFKKIKIKGVVTPLTDQISMKFQRHYLEFGSSFPLEQIGILCDLTGSGKIPYGGLKTASRQGNQQDIIEIPTVKPTFLGPASHWDLWKYRATEPEVEKSNMAASKLQMHVSLLPDKISAKFQRLCLCFRSLAFHWDS